MDTARSQDTCPGGQGGPSFQLGLFVQRMTFRDACTAWLQQHHGTTKANISEYRSILKRIWSAKPELADLDVAEVRVQHMIEIEDLLRPIALSAWRRGRAALALALDWAAAGGLRPESNPARRTIAKGYKGRSKRPSVHLIREFFPAIDTCVEKGRITEADRDFLFVATLIGCRHREITRLRVDDVDLEHRSIIVTMKRRNRLDSIDEEIPIGEWTAEVLARRVAQAKDGWLWPAPRRSGPRRVAHVVEFWPPILLELEARGVDVLDRVTGSKVVPSVTRSIAAKIRDRAGVSIIVSGRSMGHRRLQTTASYCPALEDEVRDAMQLIEQTLRTNRKPPPPAKMPEPDEKLSRSEALGSRIRSRRRELGLSLLTAAERYAAKTGNSVTRQGWAGWEKQGCGLDRIDGIALTLEVTGDWLLGLEDR